MSDHPEGNNMGTGKHDGQNEGSNPRDHTPPPVHFLKRAHRDWRVWLVVILMLAMMLVYLVTNGFSLRPGQRASQPMPEATAP